MRVQMAADMSAHDVFHGLATNTGEGNGAVIYWRVAISLFVCWRDVCVEPALGQLATRERLGEDGCQVRRQCCCSFLQDLFRQFVRSGGLCGIDLLEQLFHNQIGDLQSGKCRVGSSL